MPNISRLLLVLTICAALLASPAIGEEHARATTTPHQEGVLGKDLPGLIQANGVAGPLVVYLGCVDGILSGDVTDGRFVVQGLCRDRDKVLRARAAIQEQGCYGRVSIQHWDGERLPYADNLLNLVIVADLGRVSMEEVLRVLVPRGVAYVKTAEGWTKTEKPRPGDIDEWTHFLHGPDNNAVAEDSVVGPPRHVQWIGHPKYARSHEQLASVSAMVSAQGRLFYIIDEGLTADIRMPSRWNLVARDAFNGIVLWKRPIDSWVDHLHSFRSGPPDLPFRLVAVGDRVYVTLGQGKPVVVLDAATGVEVATCEGSENTRQILYAEGHLIMLAGSSQVAIHADRRSRDAASRFILVSDPNTGDVRWRRDVSLDTLLPMVVSDGSLVYQTDEQLVCLGLATGDPRWTVAHPVSLGQGENSTWLWASPTLLAYRDMVYVADFRKLTALTMEKGEVLWSCPSEQGFNSPPDIFVIDDLVWRGYTRKRGRADFGEGLNPRTGEVERTFATEKAWEYPTLAHHRCYRPKATSRFILSARSGTEFINVHSGEINPNHWVRGTCQYGVLPSNGLLYAPPHSCACNIKTMLRGVCALAPSRGNTRTGSDVTARLEKGPVYGKLTGTVFNSDDNAGAAAGDWPTFRHDAQRSGSAMTDVGADLRKIWKAKIGGRLSSPVVSHGKLFVAAIDAHTVHARNLADGTAVWSYTVGGRIDSPPTLYNHMVLFGSADGWVHCLCETDGTLIWRFRAAPEERWIVVRGQLESAWPVHGNVLVNEGKLVVAAGRSSYLDGGIYVYQIEPATGQHLTATVINSLDPDTDQQPPGGVDLRGVLNDVLSVSQNTVYMRHLKIDLATGDDLATGPPHLFAPMGFLDDAWWHRSYWLFGSDAVCMPPTNESGWEIWARMGNMVPSGRILCLGRDVVYGYGRDKYPGGMSGQVRGGEKYQLFAAEKDAFAPLPSNRENQHLRYAQSGRLLGLKRTARDKRYGEPSLHHNRWSRSVPLFVRAMVLANQSLWLAGPPEPAETRTANLTLENPDQAEQAFLGERGAMLWSVSAADGRGLSEWELDSLPVFDGLIAAQQRILLALEDGSVVCFGP